MDLNRNQQLALNYRWMLQAPQPLIQMAVEAGHAVYWSRRVKQAFAVNGDDQAPVRRPSSWSQLGTALNMNAKHASRYAAERDGKNGCLRPKMTLPETLLRYRVSLVLGLPEEQLSPTSREWVAQSARWLVALNRPTQSCQFDDSKYLSYADYVLADCDDLKAKRLCSSGLANATKNSPGKDPQQINDEILSVAKVIGEILANDVGLELKA